MRRLCVVAVVTGLLAGGAGLPQGDAAGGPARAVSPFAGIWRGEETRNGEPHGVATFVIDEDDSGNLVFFYHDTVLDVCDGAAGVLFGRGRHVAGSSGNEAWLDFTRAYCDNGQIIGTGNYTAVLLFEGDRVRWDPDFYPQPGDGWVGTPICDPDDPAPGTILGTNEDDVINGTKGPDVIDGLGGDDDIWGRGGDDIVCGGAGDDDLYGGWGDDVLWGGGGVDILRGGPDADGVFGGEGADEVRPQAGHDFGYGGAGNDVLDGYFGHDRLEGGPGNDAAWGRSGRDSLFGGTGNDRLSGGDGGGDSANGGDGTDTCRAESVTECETGPPPPPTTTTTAPPPPGACTPAAVPLVDDLDPRTTPNISEPAPRGVYRDPVFGTCVTRVTDRTSDPAPGDPSPGMANEYSRVQAWNADGSRLVIRGTEGSWYLYDAATYEPITQLPIGDEPRWDASDPDLLYYHEDTGLRAYDTGSGTDLLIHDFSNVLPGENLVAVWTRWEGSPSADSRTWGLMAQDDDWLAAAFVVYDRVADDVVAVRDLRGLSANRRDVDTVTITPSGNWFLGYFPDCTAGTLGTDTAPCGLMRYGRDLTGGRGLVRAIGHSDPAYTADGREVVVYQDVDTDNISMVDLATGNITPLWEIDFSHSPIGLHFSGRAFDRPGWALVSTYEGADATWMDDSVFAVELAENGRVIRLAHTHSVVDPDTGHGYFAEPQATTNRDFTKVLFHTNWGRSDSDEVDTYAVEIPAGWFTP